MAIDFKNFSTEIRDKIDEGFKRAFDGHRLTLSKMSGKLDGIVGISTNPLINGFCEKMQNIDGAICQKCYSCRLLTTARKSAIPAWTANTVVLNGEIADEDFPKIPSGSFVRFNPHGELQSDKMYENFLRICRLNPDSKFVLFTKRLDIVRRNTDEKPTNLSLVASTYFIDAPRAKVPSGFDVAFNVVTPRYAEEHGVKINCQMKCSTCLRCWNSRGIVNEKLK